MNPFTSQQAPSGMAVLPPDLAVQQQQLTRQQQMAEMLRQQAMQPSGNTEMVDGWAVKKSPYEGVAKLAQALAGGYMARDSDAKQVELTKESSKQLADTLAGYASDMQGKPEQPGQLAADGYGPPTAPTPAVPGNKQAALARLLQSGNPMLQKLGMEQMLKGEEQAKWGTTPHYDQNGNAYILDNFGNRKLLDGVKARDKMEVLPNGQAVNPYNIKEGETFNDPNNLMSLGPDGKPVVNQPLVNVKKDIANAGKSSTNVSVNTGQKGFDNTLKLRGDFRSEPIYKAHQEVQSAHSQITQSLKLASPAGDLAGATKIMKILDPGSVVRESELGMAMAATGAMDRLTNYASSVINGTKLTPKQRVDFQNLADKLNTESVKQYNNKRAEYQGIAERNQLSVQDVLGSQLPEQPGKPPAGQFKILGVK